MGGFSKGLYFGPVKGVVAEWMCMGSTSRKTCSLSNAYAFMDESET